MIQRPLADWRCSCTPRRANDLAPETRVEKAPDAVRRSAIAGRTPTTLAAIRAPAHCAWYDVRMRGFASHRQLPSAAVRTVPTDLGEPSPSGCAKTITVSPARRVGTSPESRIPRP